MMRSLLLLLTIFATGTEAQTGTDGCACPESAPTCTFTSNNPLCEIATGGYISAKDAAGGACGCTANYVKPPATMCQMNYNSTVTTIGGTKMTVKIELCERWPKDGNLTIVPPSGYSINEGATASASGVSGGLVVLVNDESITISRNGQGDDIEQTPSGHAVEIEITGVIKAPVPMTPYLNKFTEFTRTISRQCTAPPFTGPCGTRAGRLAAERLARCPNDATIKERGCLKLNDTTIKAAKDAWLQDDAAAAKKYCHITNWDVSEVTSFYQLFYNAEEFNEDLLCWDTSKVTTMMYMFRNAAAFNGDVSLWDTSKVTRMAYTFRNAAAFNGDVSLWDTSKVTSFEVMFSNAAAFNGDVSSWDVGSVTSMEMGLPGMFQGAAMFNRDLSSWDVSKLTDGSAYLYKEFSEKSGLTAAHAPRWNKPNY